MREYLARINFNIFVSLRKLAIWRNVSANRSLYRGPLHWHELRHYDISVCKTLVAIMLHAHVYVTTLVVRRYMWSKHEPTWHQVHWFTVGHFLVGMMQTRITFTSRKSCHKPPLLDHMGQFNPAEKYSKSLGLSGRLVTAAKTQNSSLFSCIFVFRSLEVHLGKTKEAKVN